MNNEQRMRAEFYSILQPKENQASPGICRARLESNFCVLGRNSDDFAQTWTWMVKNDKITYDKVTGLVWLKE